MVDVERGTAVLTLTCDTVPERHGSTANIYTSAYREMQH